MSDLLERIKKHKGVYDPTQGYAEDEAAIMAGEDSAPGMEPEEYDPEQVPAHLFGPSREEGLPGGLTKKEVASFAEQAPLAEHLDDGRKHIPDMRRPIQPEKGKSKGPKKPPAPGKRDLDQLASGPSEPLNPQDIVRTSMRGEEGELPEHEQRAYDQARQAIMNKNSGINLKPLAALLDSWYGGNLAAAAPEHVSDEDKADALSNLELKIAARKSQHKDEQTKRLDKLYIDLQKARSEGAKDKLEHKIQLLELKLAEKRAKGAGKSGSTKATKDEDFNEFKTVNKTEIINTAKDQGMDPYALLQQLKEKSKQAMEEDPSLSRSQAYATTFRLIKSGKLRPDIQKDDGGPNVGLVDDAIGGGSFSLAFPGLKG